MKILVTGGSGLVGKNLVETFSNNHTVLSPSHSELDLLDYSSVFHYLENQNPDVIIHCAGKVGGIQANIKDPLGFFVQNLDMGKNLVLAAYERKIPKFINLGSSCMYPRNAPNPLKEEMVLQGELEPTNEGYALAKVSIQRICEYINMMNSEFDYKTLVPCNLYGRWDKFDPSRSHMIPAVIHKLHMAKMNNVVTVEIWGSGEVRREFMYAGELAKSIFHVLDNYEKCPSVLNIGLGQDFTINEYYEIAAEVIGFQGSFIHDLSKPEGMKQKLVDIGRLNKLGWKNSLSLKEGIEKTYKFYLEHYAKNNKGI